MVDDDFFVLLPDELDNREKARDVLRLIWSVFRDYVSLTGSKVVLSETTLRIALVASAMVKEQGYDSIPKGELLAVLGALSLAYARRAGATPERIADLSSQIVDGVESADLRNRLSNNQSEMH